MTRLACLWPFLFQGLFFLSFRVYGDQTPLQTVEKVDIDRYLGQWYEIASIPQVFQFGCKNSRARYEATDKVSVIKVINQCERLGMTSTVKGVARTTDETNAKLKVSFFKGTEGDYWVIELDKNYSWAVVGHPDRDFLWILSREKEMSDELYAKLLEKIEKVHGYDPTMIKKSR